MTKAVVSAIVAGALAIAGLGACGGESMDARMSGCLREAKQDSSLENVDKRRVEQPEFNRAYEACAASNGVKIRPAGEEIRMVDERVRMDIRCMQAAGWALPEPKRGTHGALVWEGMDTLVPAARHDAFWRDYGACSHAAGGPGHQHEDGHKH